MKIWLDRIIKNTSYLKRISDYYKGATNTDNFEKVTCYTITESKLKEQGFNKITLETQRPREKHKLTPIELHQMRNFIENTFTLYRDNDIYLTDLDIKNYEKAISIINSGESIIDKELYDYIIVDMMKSSRRRK
jgi:hypothetical protein